MIWYFNDNVKNRCGDDTLFTLNDLSYNTLVSYLVSSFFCEYTTALEPVLFNNCAPVVIVLSLSINIISLHTSDVAPRVYFRIHPLNARVFIFNVSPVL